MGGDNHTEDRPIADIGPCAIPPRHEHLQYQDGKGLCIDGHSLTAIAAEYGTPAYVYSLPRVLANYKRIHDAFTKALEPDTVLHVHFAMKSNACGAVLRALAAAGCGADCVSDGEVRKALKFGIPASRIVFAGVGKSYAELLYAVAQNVEWINVENEREIELIERAAVELGIDRRVNVALRMNPDIAASTHPSIATGHKYAKFGVPRSRVEAILAEAETLYPHCHIGAVHVHIGSQLGDTEATVAAVQAAVDVAKPHYPRVRHINIGGGFPVPYKAEQASLPLADAFAAAVAPLLKGFEVSLEPGRSISADAGVMLTEALYRKEQDGARILVVDASMVELIRPALYGSHHEPLPLAAAPASAADGVVDFQIVGPVCESTDVLCGHAGLNDAATQPGALFAFCTAGAYCSTMAGNYNARLRPPEVVVSADGSRVVLARRRETPADLDVTEQMDAAI